MNFLILQLLLQGLILQLLLQRLILQLLLQGLILLPSYTGGVGVGKVG